MSIKLDKILLCILWLLAVTLGGSFMFNTIFGFDIFSAAHWQYLSYLQASKEPVSNIFYISLVLLIFTTIFGLYVLFVPRLRTIKFPKIFKKNKQNQQTNVPNNQTDASTLDILPAEEQGIQLVQPQKLNASTMRPPRLHLSIPTTNTPNTISSNPYPPQRQNMTQTSATTTKTPDYSEIRDIFTQAGYTTKQAPRINGIQTALLAIGNEENLWLGAVGIKTTELRAMIDKLSQIFSDTLDDIYINVNGFVINAVDAQTSEAEDILMFNSISDLQEYIQTVPNPPINEEEKENFEAYSEYIDTVIKYIGNL